MTFSRQTLALAVLAALAAPVAHAEITIDQIGGSEVSFEGLVQTDGYWYDSDVVNLDADALDGKDHDFGLRRSEIVLKGKGPGNYEWVLGYDTSGSGKFLDTNVKYKLGGNSNNSLMFGQFKQPNSMEELSSTKNNDFVAKAAITNTFGVARRLGGSWTYGDSNWGGTVSAFGRELTRNRAHGSGYGARGYFSPINDKDNILHFGVSYVDYDTDADTIRLRARPDSDLSNRIVDAGNFTNADRVSTLGLESFYVSGPFKIQGEYMRTEVDRYSDGLTTQPGKKFKSDGGYVSALWNVTGETWGYKGGTPTTPLPDEPASGMWQLGLRYDTLDLNDGGILGGKLETVTAGVNWYWRSNFKFAVNYVAATSDRNNVNDDPNITEVRAQLYW